MKRNLILVSPKLVTNTDIPDTIPSLALLHLSGSAREICDDIRVFDYNTPLGRGKTTPDLLSLINTYCVDANLVVGINCFYSAQFADVRELAKSIKRSFPQVKVITGGIHPTIFVDDIRRNCSEFDAILLGESDITFQQLLLHYYTGKRTMSPIVRVEDGYVIREKGKLLSAPKNTFCDVNSLAFPGYEYFSYTEYEVDTSNWYLPNGYDASRTQIPLWTSRGCPHQCNFCSMKHMGGAKYRPLSAENVFKQIEHVNKKYGINYFKIMDDNFTFDKERVIAICKLIIDSGMQLYFETPNGLSCKTLDAELLSIMRKAGFIRIAVAVESGSDYIRNEIMRKHTTKQQILDAFDIAKKVGIQAKAYFIVGMPEETEESLNDTKDLIERISVESINLSVITPLPGTRLFEQCVRDNLFTDSKYVITWEGDNSIEDTASNYFGMQSTAKTEEYSPRTFRVKPYYLSLQKLAELDKELQILASRKSYIWRQRVQRNAMNMTINN
jgi:magnesium-protoporphyrin IX monomethyl ester (oxidative) cyclase